MSNPHQQWQPQAPQPGPYQPGSNSTGQSQQYPSDPRFQGPPQPYPPDPQHYGVPGPWGGYGPPQPVRRAPAFDLTKVAAAIVVIAGLAAFVASLFALYSVTVTPAAANVPNNDAPPGQIEVGIGFYDIVPFAPPIVAEAIPTLMVLAALTAAHVLFGGSRSTGALSAVFAGTATLLSVMLAIANPLPAVELDGQMADKLNEELSGQSLGDLIDSVVSVGPGAGLIVALVFALIGWIAAAVMVFRRPPPAAQQLPAPNMVPQW